jgi:hypothetical protein
VVQHCAPDAVEIYSRHVPPRRCRTPRRTPSLVGDYDTAILETLISLEVTVRTKGGFTNMGVTVSFVCSRPVPLCLCALSRGRKPALARCFGCSNTCMARSARGCRTGVVLRALTEQQPAAIARRQSARSGHRSYSSEDDSGDQYLAVREMRGSSAAGPARCSHGPK